MRRVGLRSAVGSFVAVASLMAIRPVWAQERDRCTPLSEDAANPVGSVNAETAKSPKPKTDASKPEGSPLVAAIPTKAASTPSANAVVETPAPPLTSTLPHAQRFPLTFGGDVYFGGTNATGVRARSNDGVWAGYGSAYPSVFSVNWQPNETHNLRVSIGVGDMFTGHHTTFRQPVEAAYQSPFAGRATMTVGKFYVPFATQEWEYESKYGCMLQKTQGAMSYTGALNYNFRRRTPNFYLRFGRQFGPNTTFGFSGGGGCGVFSDTSHALALGIDATHNFGAAQFSMEYNLAQGGKGVFQFIYGKLTLTRGGRFTPYVGAYYWHDTAQELGQFHSVLVGMNYKMTSHLSLEGGYARGNARNIIWLQSHVSF